ncbi:YciI family protein [Caballeronia sp. LjRoot34]|uniref:YciI family protein n=1 Tax=Caballeronia sp. LjRoot34 TaxID=3342325 RepID=UPI003ED0F3C9
MKFLCLIVFDERVLDDLSKRQYDALVDESLAYDERLRETRQLIAAQALHSAREAVTLRVRGEDVSITDGPFAETKEQVGGFVLIEARDMNEAMRIASGFPVVRLGGVEVRPVRELRASWPDA